MPPEMQSVGANSGSAGSILGVGLECERTSSVGTKCSLNSLPGSVADGPACQPGLPPTVLGSDLSRAVQESSIPPPTRDWRADDSGGQEPWVGGGTTPGLGQLPGAGGLFKDASAQIADIDSRLHALQDFLRAAKAGAKVEAR